MKNINFTLQPQDNDRLNNVCGSLDENLLQIEKYLAIEISHRSHAFKVIGPQDIVVQAKDFIENLYRHGEEPLTSQALNVSLHALLNDVNQHIPHPSDAELQQYSIQTPKILIKPKGPNQRRYIKRIGLHDISFGIGPAGTGKTYLAVASAVAAFEIGKVNRIILVRPAVEAGESLGFLPGDLTQKIDPYLRPIYDALYEFMGIEKVAKLIERNIIEIAPLAFMRGRTLNDAYIILDESQNTTKEQMKMFLTRIGFNSTTIITGDITQIDLPRGKTSGLRHVINVLSDVEGLSFTFFDARDVVRHSLVQQIVAAYDLFEAENVE